MFTLPTTGLQKNPRAEERRACTHFPFSVVVGVFFWFFLCAGALRAEFLTLDDLVVDNADGIMTVHYGVQVHDAEGIRTALLQGLHLRFTGTATLYKKRSLWWDKFLAENSFVCDLRHDALKQEVVLCQGTEEKRFPLEEFVEYLNVGLRNLSIPIGSWDLIQRGNVYQIQLCLTLTREDVPAWIRIPLFFWSWDLFPDNTFQMEFSY